MIFIRITARIGADGNTKTNGSNVSMIFDVNRSRRTVTANGCCRAEGFGVYRCITRNCDRGITRSIKTLTDATAIIASSIHSGMIGDGNITVACRLITGSNGSTRASKGSNICIALNADIRTCSIGTAADTGAVRTAADSDLTTGDGNVGSIGKFFPS